MQTTHKLLAKRYRAAAATETFAFVCIFMKETNRNGLRPFPLVVPLSNHVSRPVSNKPRAAMLSPNLPCISISV